MEIRRGVRRLFPCAKLVASEQQVSRLLIGVACGCCILEFEEGEKLKTPQEAVIIKKNASEYMLYGYSDDVVSFFGTELPKDLAGTLSDVLQNDLGTFTLISQTTGENPRVAY